MSYSDESTTTRSSSFSELSSSSSGEEKSPTTLPLSVNAVCTWDFTLRRDVLDAGALKALIKDHCKKWSYQLEKGSTGYEHFQGRVSLKLKTRTPNKLGFPRETHWSVTSGANKDNDFYVTKSEGRLDGPYTDKDVDIYIPRQVREMKELYPWQAEIVKSAEVWDTRTVNILIDPEGNKGKSFIKTYIGCKKIGRCIPFANDYKDIMRMVMDMPKTRLYIIDMPRALDKAKLSQFYAGVESLKDGYAYDDRYKFKEEYFDSPTIWIFTNKMPDMKMLSKDRWALWTFKDNKTIKEINKPFEERWTNSEEERDRDRVYGYGEIDLSIEEEY